MIEMKSEVKKAKLYFEKQFEQWSYLNDVLTEELERVRTDNMLKWAKQ